MTIDEPKIRHAIILLSDESAGLATAVWDLLHAYHQAAAALAALAPKKPTLPGLGSLFGHDRMRVAYRDDGSPYVVPPRPSAYIVTGPPVTAGPGDIIHADPNLGQLAGQKRGDTTVYVLQADGIFHRLARAYGNCGHTAGDAMAVRSAVDGGYEPCGFCYPGWADRGRGDCYACIAETGCAEHACNECQGSGDDPSGRGGCKECLGLGLTPPPLQPCPSCATPRRIGWPCRGIDCLPPANRLRASCFDCGSINSDPDHVCVSPDRQP